MSTTCVSFKEKKKRFTVVSGSFTRTVSIQKIPPLLFRLEKEKKESVLCACHRHRHPIFHFSHTERKKGHENGDYRLPELPAIKRANRA